MGLGKEELPQWLLKEPCPRKTPQVVVALMGQATAGVPQALYAALIVL